MRIIFKYYIIIIMWTALFERNKSHHPVNEFEFIEDAQEKEALVRVGKRELSPLKSPGGLPSSSVIQPRLRMRGNGKRLTYSEAAEMSPELMCDVNFLTPASEDSGPECFETSDDDLDASEVL